MSEEKKGLPEFFTIVYMSDVVTTLVSAMIWGGFPYTNTITVEMVNAAIGWIVFKLIVYLIIIYVYRYYSRYSKYAENILISVTVIYSIFVLNTLSSLTLNIPATNISPEFLEALEQNRMNIIP